MLSSNQPWAQPYCTNAKILSFEGRTCSFFERPTRIMVIMPKSLNVLPVWSTSDRDRLWLAEPEGVCSLFEGVEYPLLRFQVCFFIQVSCICPSWNHVKPGPVERAGSLPTWRTSLHLWQGKAGISTGLGSHHETYKNRRTLRGHIVTG